MAYVIRNRAAPDTSHEAYRNEALRKGAFAFTLTELERDPNCPVIDETCRIVKGGDSVFVANLWANVANTDSERIQYEHSLSYVVAVANDWIHDPSHGARYTSPSEGYTYFGTVDVYGQYNEYWLPYWP